MTSFTVQNMETVGLERDRNTTLQSPVWGLYAKRFTDLLIAGLVAVTVLTWLIPILALLIRLTSKGPALFVQIRSGRNGEQFPCFKFRTMAYNPDAQFQQASKNDFRVTRIGRVLRKTNLDEMPQFLNVLLGHMSIVGPRPHPLPLDAQYWNTMPGYRERYFVKPGITGLAQVRGARGETGKPFQMKHRVRYDHLYIQQQSPGLDIRICWWTIKAALNGNPNAW